MAAVYWLACRQWPVLLRRPVAAGVAYGIGTYLAMNYVVVPLSRATPPPFILPWFIDSVLAHVPSACCSHSLPAGPRIEADVYA